MSEDGVAVSMVLVRTLRAKPMAASRERSSEYSCFRTDWAAEVFAPTHVAFQPP